MEISTIELSSPAGFPFSFRRVARWHQNELRGKQWVHTTQQICFRLLSIPSILIQKRQYLNDAATGSKYSMVNRRQRRNVNSFYLHGQYNESAHHLDTPYACY